MTFSVTQFKSNLSKGGARPSLFKVDLKYPTGISSPDVKSEFLIRASSLPASNLGSHEVFFHGKSIKVAGDRTYDTWDTTIINDEDFETRIALEGWINRISNHKLNTRKFSIGEGEDVSYKETLTVTQFSKTGKKILSYNFINAFPTAISPITLDWNASEIEEFTCTWTYDYWTRNKSENSSEHDESEEGETDED